MLTSSETGKNITQGFDGDGQRVKFVENSTTTYYVRSSALGGQTITEVDQSGTKKRGYVYAGGAVIAKQEGSQVLWDHSDVSGVSRRLTNSSGTVTSKVETDPLGTQVDDTANYNYSGGGSGSYNPMGFYGTPQMPNMGCSVQSVPTPCSMATHMVNVGMYKPDQVLFGAPGTNGSLSGFGGLANIDYRIGGRGNPSNAITSHGRGYAFENGYLWMNDQTPNSGDRGRRGEFVDLNHQQDSLRPLGRSEISSLIDDIYKLFKDYPDCEGWTNKLLAKMAKSSGFSAGTIRDILENFRKNGTIFADSSRSASGSGSGGTGTKLTGYPAISLDYGGKTENTAETLLHEIIHWAGMPATGSGYGDYYNDVAMANAWIELGVVISVAEYRRQYPEAVAKYEADYEAAFGVKGMAFLESRLSRAAGGVACLNQDNGLRKLP